MGGVGDGEAEAALRKELVLKQRELQQLQESFDEYSQSSQELEQELEQELARAEQRNSQLSTRVQRLENELEDMRERLDATQHEMRKCETELGTLKTELARVTALKRQLEQEQDELTTQVRILQATEEDLRHKMEREMEEKVFLLSDQEELKREHELVTERLRTEIMDLKSELFAVQQKNEALEVEREQVAQQARMSSGSDRMDVDGNHDDGAVVLRLSTLQERDESDREQLIETLQRELDVLSARLQEETDARERLEIEYLEAQDSLAQAEAMENEMTEMSDELIEKSQEIRKRDLEIQALQETATALKVENAALLEENADLRAAAESNREASQSDGQEMVRALQMQYNQLEEAEQQLQQRLEDEQQLTTRLRKANDDLTRQVHESVRMREQLEAQLDAQVKKKQKELEELQELNASLRRQLETAARKAADLEQKASAVSVSSSSSSTSSSSTEEKPVPSSKEADVRRYLLEIQSLRANISSLHAENARLRNSDSSPSTLLPNKRVSADLLKVNYTPEQLARKYLAERTRNAALLSRLQTVCGNIQVFCRVRPVIGEELERSYGSKLGVNVINQSDVAAMDIRPERIPGSDSNQPPDANTGDLEMLDMDAQWRVFTFDRVIGPTETQLDVFREVEPIAQSVVEGFKACIFAYGQTGSGKTYTMEGTKSDPGLNYRVISHIFQSIVLRGSVYDPDSMEEDALESEIMEGEEPLPKSELCYHIQVGVLEIYNESLRDLVNPENSNPLEIRQDPNTGDILVPELTMATAASPDQMMSILRRAQSNRVTGKTDVNAHSSRSHSVVIIQISSRMGNSNQSDAEGLVPGYVSGKLYLVDLAGSERVKKSNVSGAMLREAAHINKSLSALADVMEALDKKHAHVPYRNSKLTYLLQDVLNTSCKTVMIVNCGPTIESANETFRSLQLAERVRHIVVGRNSITPNGKDLMSAKRAFSEIQSLKQQLQAANRKVKQSQQAVLGMKRDQKSQSDQVATTLQARAKAAETQLTNLRTQSEKLKQINDELTRQLKEEREAKQKESDQREAAQRSLRHMTSKTRVSSSHQESLERQLKDREDEIKKLRQMLTEARQRTTTSVIPRHKAGQSTQPTKKARQNDEPLRSVGATATNNQEDEDTDMEQHEEPLKSGPGGSSTKIPAPRYGFARHNSSNAVGSTKKSVYGAKSDAGGASKLRRIASSCVASTSGTSSASRPGWK